MRRYWTLALVAVAAFSAFLIQTQPSLRTRDRLVPCKLLAEPETLTCANGHVYIVHRGNWQDLGPTARLPGVPKQ